MNDEYRDAEVCHTDICDHLRQSEAVVAAAKAWLRRNRRWLDDPTAGEEEDHALALAVDALAESER